VRAGAGVIALVVAATAAPVRAAGAADPAAIELGAFSQAPRGAELPAAWEPLTFPGFTKRTTYRLVDDGGTTVLRADAQGAASGLIRRSETDPGTYPVLAWRWKIAGVVDGADATRRDGDDYAARVYVVFKYDPARASVVDRVKRALLRLFYSEDLPHAGIAYIWDNRLPPGTVLASPYTDRVRMIVVRSGNAEAGRWQSEERNVLDDYRRAFGEEPPAIAGVAVMTDSDDTGGSATGWFGDIVLRRAW